MDRQPVLTAVPEEAELGTFDKSHSINGNSNGNGHSNGGGKGKKTSRKEKAKDKDKDKEGAKVDPLDLVVENCAKEPIHLIDVVQSHGALIAVRVASKKIAIASENAADMLSPLITLRQTPASPRKSPSTTHSDDTTGASPSSSSSSSPIQQHLLGRKYKHAFSGCSQLRKMIKEYIRNGHQDLQVGTIHLTQKQQQHQQSQNEGSGEICFDVSLHKSGKFLVVEFVPIPTGDFVTLKLLQSVLTTLDEFKDFASSSKALVHKMKDIAGFDRVLVYKFDQEYNGVVIAEATEDHLDGFMGHHFPASDIPAQARALLVKNPVRAWTATGGNPARLLYDGEDPLPTPTPTPTTTNNNGDNNIQYYQRLEQGLRVLDMSFCLLRGYSPVHLQYLQNMGVGATLSFGIMAEGGRLWGLIACHHMTPKVVSFSRLKAIQLLALLYSQKLVHSEAEQLISVGLNLDRKLKKLLNSYHPYTNPASWLIKNAQEFMTMFGAHGIHIRVEHSFMKMFGRRNRSGSTTPSDAEEALYDSTDSFSPQDSNSPITKGKKDKKRLSGSRTSRKGSFSSDLQLQLHLHDDPMIWTEGITLPDDMVKEIVQRVIDTQQTEADTPHPYASHEIIHNNNIGTNNNIGNNNNQNGGGGKKRRGSFGGGWSSSSEDGSSSGDESCLMMDDVLATPFKVFATERLSEFYPPAEEHTETASGILVIPLYKEDSYMVLFRPRVQTTVVWAGRPEKEATERNGRMVLNPRSSFKAWEQLMSNRSTPWEDKLISEAKFLSEFLLEQAIQYHRGPGYDDAWRAAMFLNLKEKLTSFFSHIFKWAEWSLAGDKPKTELLPGSINPHADQHDDSMSSGKIKSLQAFIQELADLPPQDFQSRINTDFRNIAMCLQADVEPEELHKVCHAFLVYCGAQRLLPEVIQWAIEVEFFKSSKRRKGANKVAFRESKSTGTLIISALLQSEPGSEYLRGILEPLLKFVGDDKNINPSEEDVLGVTKSILERIYRVRNCPIFIREMLFLVYIHMCRVFGDVMTSSSSRLIAVSSLFFLRFVCSAVVFPDKFGLTTKGRDALSAHRSTLVAVSRNLQKLLSFVLAEQDGSSSDSEGEFEGRGSLPIDFIQNSIYPLRGFLRDVVDSVSIKVAAEEYAMREAKEAGVEGSGELGQRRVVVPFETFLTGKAKGLTAQKNSRKKLQKALANLAKLCDSKQTAKAQNYPKRCCWKPYFE